MLFSRDFFKQNQSLWNVSTTSFLDSRIFWATPKSKIATLLFENDYILSQFFKDTYSQPLEFIAREKEMCLKICENNKHTKAWISVVLSLKYPHSDRFIIFVTFAFYWFE